MRKIKNYELFKHTKLTNIKEMLSYCVDKHSTPTAFMYQNKKSDVIINYVQFEEDVDALGTYLFNNGFKDCHIAVFGENSYEWILSHFAVTCGGNVIVPIDKDLDAEDISYLLKDSECKAIFFSDTYADIIEDLQKANLGSIAYFNMLDIPKMVEQGKSSIEKGNREYLDVAIEGNYLASIVYTSGTTGKSKGVMLTHNNFCSNVHGACCNVTLSGSTVLMLPLHHSFGLVASVYAPMFYGVSIYINKSMKKLLDDFKKCKPEHLFAVPLIAETIYKNIWNTAKKQGKDKLLRLLVKISNGLRKCGIDLRKVLFKSVISAFGGNLNLIVCGGAPLSTELIKGFDSLGITLLNGYGITECSPIVAVNRNKFYIVGSVGLPLCCNQVKISEEGEVLVKGENVMVGYYHNEEENQKVFVDGWFKTGDIGTIDEYGALHITGRIKNLIILPNGENVAAEELEEKIYGITYVKEVVVYEKDNMIAAEIYLDEEYDEGKDKINTDIQKINRGLPLIKNIGKIIIRDTEFPKTTTKKIKRNYKKVD